MKIRLIQICVLLVAGIFVMILLSGEYRKPHYTQLTEKQPNRIVHAPELYDELSGSINEVNLRSIGTGAVGLAINASLLSNRYSYAGAYLSLHAYIVDNADKLTGMMEAAVINLKRGLQPDGDATGRVASLVRQVFDRPVTTIAKNILDSKKAMEFLGIRSSEQYPGENGTVNIYTVDDSGFLVRMMDLVMGLTGGGKAGGCALYPLGIFINASIIPSDSYSFVLFHEYAHYYQQSLCGLPLWASLYSGEIMVNGLLHGNLAQGYKTCSWETAADGYAYAMRQKELNGNLSLSIRKDCT